MVCWFHIPNLIKNVTLRIRRHYSLGRFFASLELKATLYYIIMNYDLTVKDGIRPPNDSLGIGVLPSADARMKVRKRMHSSMHVP
jgi:hypothetical protein